MSKRFDLMSKNNVHSFPVLDTHTGGEITRVVMGDTIGLSPATAVEHRLRLHDELDWVRQSLTSEPRGSAFAVGAVVTPCTIPGVPWSVVFFNNVGYLGMCGHGLIGVVESLRHSGKVVAGTHRFATPPGTVSAVLDGNREVSFSGLRSWCERENVTVVCSDGRTVTGEIAYGGNWFFLVHDEDVAAADEEELLNRCVQIRDALAERGIRGADDAEIDHIELFCSLSEADGGSAANENHFEAVEIGSRNFVLCPGGHYDRSPCGTGTSAKLAALAAKGQLEPGRHWIQQSVTGSRFVASYQPDPPGVRVTISGRAHVIAETIQIYDPHDTLRFGIGVRP